MNHQEQPQFSFDPEQLMFLHPPDARPDIRLPQYPDGPPPAQNTTEYTPPADQVVDSTVEEPGQQQEPEQEAGHSVFRQEPTPPTEQPGARKRHATLRAARFIVDKSVGQEGREEQRNEQQIFTSPAEVDQEVHEHVAVADATPQFRERPAWMRDLDDDESDKLPPVPVAPNAPIIRPQPEETQHTNQTPQQDALPPRVVQGEVVDPYQYDPNAPYTPPAWYRDQSEHPSSLLNNNADSDDEEDQSNERVLPPNPRLTRLNNNPYPDEPHSGSEYTPDWTLTRHSSPLPVQPESEQLNSWQLPVSDPWQNSGNTGITQNTLNQPSMAYTRQQGFGHNAQTTMPNIPIRPRSPNHQHRKATRRENNPILSTDPNVQDQDPTLRERFAALRYSWMHKLPEAEPAAPPADTRELKSASYEPGEYSNYDPTAIYSEKRPIPEPFRAPTPRLWFNIPGKIMDWLDFHADMLRGDRRFR